MLRCSWSAAGQQPGEGRRGQCSYCIGPARVLGEQQVHLGAAGDPQARRPRWESAIVRRSALQPRRCRCAADLVWPGGPRRSARRRGRPPERPWRTRRCGRARRPGSRAAAAIRSDRRPDPSAANSRAYRRGDRLFVTHDRDVDHGIERTRTEVRVHGLHRHPGGTSDLPHSGAGPSVRQELLGRSGDDPVTGLSASFSRSGDR